MAADPSHLTDVYESDHGLMQSYCAGYRGTDQHCNYPDIANGVKNGVVSNVGQIPEEDMSIGSSTDDSVAASAVFRHLDNLIRQRIDGEIEQLKSSVHRILSDQQQEFVQAFGLQDEYSSSEASSHVVPQGNYCDDESSDDCQLLMEDTSDCEATMIRQYEYDEPLCSNCKSELRTVTTTNRQEEDKADEEKIVMNYMLRLMTASSTMANTLKRKEYRT